MGGETPPGSGDGGETPAELRAVPPAELPPAELRPAELRASHQDRDQVVEVLRVAAGDGRLSPDELDERLEVAMTARTYAELAALTKDLPAAPGLLPGAPAPEPKELVRIDCHGSASKREGRWLVPKRMEVKVTSGVVTLDFTEALITWPALAIDADVASGSLQLVTRPGIVVDADDVAMTSGVVKVRPPGGPEVPVVLRIQLSGRVGSGVISVRPPRLPRRTFWQWLRRRPRRSAIAAR